ncbi:MAG: dynamin family protein [Thermodesulfobacteriota bacterium]
MESFPLLKQELLEDCEELTAQLEQALSIPEFADQQLKAWARACKSARQQISEEIIRIAVVGPIKSGKSTFVNSLLKGDYLKRGAGVVTSFVTRVRRGPTLNAQLRFKTWEEINADIFQALAILPGRHERGAAEAFDIRRRKDRSELWEALNGLTADQLITRSTRNLNSVLLTSYLQGYEQIKGMNFQENMLIEYKTERFNEHRSFSGDEILAVYLKDIQLEVDTAEGFDNVELADCQGSDSPNPLHLALIQDYLLTAHLLIYVISSRTGLRQADIRFLSMIKKMGIMDNILFVVNCDFSEHDDMAGLHGLLEKIGAELALMKPDPELYAFSSLFNLFRTTEDTLSAKDRHRLEQWRGESSFVVFSDQETERFKAQLFGKISGERYVLLLKNHVERLRLVAAGITHWAAMRRDVLAGDRQRVGTITGRIRAHQQKMEQLSTMMRKTLDGAAQQIKNGLRKDVDRYFDARYGEVIGDVREFIRSYRVDTGCYQEEMSAVGFNQILYSVYQDFKQALDTFMAQTVNPKIIGFLHLEEKTLLEALESIGRPFAGMVEDALLEYEKAVGDIGIPVHRENRNAFRMPDPDMLKRIAGLKAPPASAIMRYSARVKSVALMRFGFYSLAGLLKKILKKPVDDAWRGASQAIEDGVERLKRETEYSIQYHFKNYRENIKFQYLFKLVEVVAAALHQGMMDRFQAYNTDLAALTALLDEKQVDKERMVRIVEEVGRKAEASSAAIAHLDSKLMKWMN